MSPLLVSKFQSLITHFPPQRKKPNKPRSRIVVLNLLSFHHVSCSCIVCLPEMEGMVMSSIFAKAFINLLSCTLCCTLFSSLVHLHHCVAVSRYATLDEESWPASQEGLASKCQWNGLSGRKVSFIFMSCQRLPCSGYINVSRAERQSGFIIRWVFEK